MVQKLTKSVVLQSVKTSSNKCFTQTPSNILSLWSLAWTSGLVKWNGHKLARQRRGNFRSIKPRFVPALACPVGATSSVAASAIFRPVIASGGRLFHAPSINLRQFVGNQEPMPEACFGPSRRAAWRIYDVFMTCRWSARRRLASGVRYGTVWALDGVAQGEPLAESSLHSRQRWDEE